jgi:predicted enzyme related to lactoylglutathione lyase
LTHCGQRSLFRVSGIALLLATLATACTTVQYDLPAVATDGDGGRRPGKFVWRDLISDQPAASRDFFTSLFQWEFRKLPLIVADYWTITLHGDLIGGMVDQASIDTKRDISQWISVLSVDDAEATERKVREAGGTVYRSPVAVGSRGTIAVYGDPSGAVFAALQTRDGDPRDSTALPPQGYVSLARTVDA